MQMRMKKSEKAGRKNGGGKMEDDANENEKIRESREQMRKVLPRT